MSRSAWLGVAVACAGCGTTDVPGEAARAGGLVAREVDCATATVDREVEIVNFTFQPGDFAVWSGSTVRWTNTSRSRHTVTSGDPLAGDGGDVFDSGALGPRDTWCLELTGAGELQYYCRFHALIMAGATLRVFPEPAAPAAGAGVESAGP